MSRINITVDKINSLKVTDIVHDEIIRQRFIDIYGALWGEREAEAAYERESIHFNRLLSDNEKLRQCTKVSIFIAFIDLAVCGLSLEPGVRALAYLQPRGFKTGKKDDRGNDVYESRCGLVISGYGELVLRTRAGQIRHADNPVIVYEGDEFSFSDRDGQKSVSYTMNLDHNPQVIRACFMRITRADGSIDYAVMLPEDWLRLQGYSAKANKYYDRDRKQWVENANALYTSGEGNRIDSGFLMAKCIKHAFKTYPKVRIGKGTSYEADEQPQQQEDFYGGVDPEEQPQEDRSDKPESFAPAPDHSAGITIDPAADGASDDETW